MECVFVIDLGVLALLWIASAPFVWLGAMVVTEGEFWGALMIAVSYSAIVAIGIFSYVLASYPNLQQEYYNKTHVWCQEYAH